MTDFLRLCIIFIAAVNPAGAALTLTPGGTERPRRAGIVAGAALALGLMLAAAAFANPVLDFLDIAPESFRLAAGVVLAAVGVVFMLAGRLPLPADDSGDAMRAAAGVAGVVAGPAALTAAVSYGADERLGLTGGAVVVAVLLAIGILLAARPRDRVILVWGARVLGALLVAIAAGLATSGVRAI